MEAVRVKDKRLAGNNQVGRLRRKNEDIGSQADNRPKNSEIQMPRTEVGVDLPLHGVPAGSVREAKYHVMFIVENYSLDTQGLRASLKTLTDIYSNHFAAFPTGQCDMFRQEICEFFVDKGGVPIMCDIIADYLIMGWFDSEGQVNQAAYETLDSALTITVNFPDASPIFSEAVAVVPGFFKFIGNQLRNFHHELTVGDSFTWYDNRVTARLLGITLNSSALEVSRKILRKLDYTNIIFHYLSVWREDINLVALMSLAYLVDEIESLVLNEGLGLKGVQLLLNTLYAALKSRSRRSMGWSVIKLTRAVSRLATNDNNKKILVLQGVLPLLLQLCIVGHVTEQTEALGTLWLLSFDAQNKNFILKEPGLIRAVVELENSPVEEVRKAAQGIHWTLNENNVNLTPGGESTGNRSQQPGGKPTATSLGESRGGPSGKPSGGPGGAPSGRPVDGQGVRIPHVMISYQWASQNVMLRIRDNLKAHGYKIWMDVDHMTGSLLDSMADAIENSSVVLVGVSRKYKASQNCRAEAHYTYQRQIPIIPLKMESDYNPDGWLGNFVAATLFIDFSGKFSFDTQIDSLMKELGERGKLGLRPSAKSQGNVKVTQGHGEVDHIEGKPPSKGQGNVKVPQEHDEVNQNSRKSQTKGHGNIEVNDEASPRVTDRASTKRQRSNDVREWNNVDISTWLVENDLHRPPLTSLTGEILAYLKRLKSESPKTYYRLLWNDWSLKNTQDLMTFEKVLMNLN